MRPFNIKVVSWGELIDDGGLFHLEDGKVLGGVRGMRRFRKLFSRPAVQKRRELRSRVTSAVN